MNFITFISLFFLLLSLAYSFYISKLPIPTLFINQETKFTINHNAGQNIKFKAEVVPQFITVIENGTLIFFPRKQTMQQIKIRCINIVNNQTLTVLSYLIKTLDKQKEYEKSFWIIDEQSYYDRATDRPLAIYTQSFDYHANILTNENIIVKLKTKHSVGSVFWYFQDLPETMTGNRVTGSIVGYVQEEGNYIIKCTVIDQTFRVGQLYLFIKFSPTYLSVDPNGFTTYPQYDYRKMLSIKQKQQNSALLENQLKSLKSKKEQIVSRRMSVITNFRNISLFKQQLILDQQVISQQVVNKKKASENQEVKKSNFQKDLGKKKSELDLVRKVLNDKQKDYSNKLQQFENQKSMKQLLTNQSNLFKKQFDSIKIQINNLQNQIYQLQNQIRETQYNKSRYNITYVSLQKEEVRTREVLQIRKNIQFQYLIKKAQTDNKVQRNQDYVFLAESNYDSAYIQYKKQSQIYLQYSIESTYLFKEIQTTLNQFYQLNKTLNKLKLSYSIALGNVQKLKTTKDQLIKLSSYALNSIISTSNNDNLTDIQLIDKEAKKSIEQYPFTGCNKLGNLQWAGSGKIKMLGKNSLTLGSEEVINFGQCTSIKSNKNHSEKINLVQQKWIQFFGYYWNDAIQATEILFYQDN